MDITRHETSNPSRYDVRQDGRLIGFLMDMPLAERAGWRFIANRKEVAERMPVPAPHFDTVEEALADLISRIC